MALYYNLPRDLEKLMQATKEAADRNDSREFKEAIVIKFKGQDQLKIAIDDFVGRDYSNNFVVLERMPFVPYSPKQWETQLSALITKYLPSPVQKPAINKDLITAAFIGDPVMVSEKLDQGADINTRFGDDGSTPLIVAIMSGATGTVKLLLDRGADVNLADSRGRTPVILAVAEGHSEVVDILLKKGANVHTRTDAGSTALMFAVQKGRTDIAELLRKAGARE